MASQDLLCLNKTLNIINRTPNYWVLFLFNSSSEVRVFTGLICPDSNSNCELINTSSHQAEKTQFVLLLPGHKVFQFSTALSTGT